MPTHITHSGLDAHAANHKELGRIWLIYRAGIPHGFARQLSYNDWMHWADLEAMRGGEKRCYHHGPKLETIMDLIAQERIVPLTPRTNTMNKAEELKSQICSIYQDYLDGLIPSSDRELAVEAMDQLGDEHEGARAYADMKIKALFIHEYDNAA